MTGYSWKVEYCSVPRGTDMNDAFDQATLRLNIYSPDIRGRARW